MFKKLFGTDGIRGVPAEFPLDAATLYALGRALGGRLEAKQANPAVLVGIDTRESSELLAAWITQGLVASGRRVVFAGVFPTPGIAYQVRASGFAAGIVISGSHNPYSDNGVKLIASSGMKFPDEFEAELEEQIGRERQGAPAAAEHRWLAAGDPALRERYLSYLRGRVIAGAELRGMKLVVDCANGAASQVAPELFRSLGMDVVAIHDHPDGRNINAGCGSLYPESLREEVLAQRATLGVAFDGDADRAIFVAASGQIVNGDGTLLVVARYWRAQGWLKGGKIVGTTMANLGLERALAAEGIRLERVPVGDRYVLEEMLRSGANLGGEQSGHIIFLDDATTGDGLLTTIKMASLVARLGLLDELVRDLEIFPQKIVNVRVRAKPPLETLPSVSQALAEARGALGDSGRVVLRYSGTEAVARVMVEAASEADVARWSGAIAAAIRERIGADK